MPISKRGRPPKYSPVDIGLRSIQIIRTLGADCKKADVASAFYDPTFKPNKEGERKRLLDASLKARQSKAMRKRRLVAYTDLLNRAGLDFDNLCKAVEMEMQPFEVLIWLLTIDQKITGKKKYSIPINDLPKEK